MQILLGCVIFIYGLINACSGNIQQMVTRHFESSTMKMFYQHWQKYRRPLENSLEQMLKEMYSDRSMNIYVKHVVNEHKVAKGFLVSDNIVHVLFKDLYLTEFPRLMMPQVSFALASNVLRVDADVDRILVDAKYLLFRNLSDIDYSVKTFDPFRKSPFSLQQVQNEGQATIVVDGCVLSGFTIARLHAASINLGHHYFRLRKCKYSVEISNPEQGSPPVIAPYFSKEQSTQLGLLLVEHLQEEVMAKLQGAMFTFVNTSAILGERLAQVRQEQQAIFAKTAEFMTKVVANLNKAIFTKNRGVAKLEDEIISWSDKHKGKLQENKVTVSDLSLRGLDSIYSAQSGGPFRVPTVKIEETVRLASLQVRGNIMHEEGLKKNEYGFYGEIQDLYVQFSLSIQEATKTSEDSNNTKLSKTLYKVEVLGWRKLDLNTPEILAIPPQSLITGVLLNKIPILIIQHLSQLLGGAISSTSKNRNQNIGPDAMGNTQVEDNMENDEVAVEDKPQNEDKGEDKVNEGYGSDGNKDAKSNSMVGKMFNKPMFQTPMLGDDVPVDAIVDDKTSLDHSNPQGQDVEQNENIGDDIVLSDIENAKENDQEEDVEQNRSEEGERENAPPKSMLGKPMFGQPMFDNANVALAGDKSEGNNKNHKENLNNNSGDRGNAQLKLKNKTPIVEHSMLGQAMFAKPMLGKPIINEDVALAEGYNENPEHNINNNSGGNSKQALLVPGIKGMFAKPMFGKPTMNENVALAGDKSGTILNDSQDAEQDENEEGYDENQEENINHNPDGILNAGPKPAHGHSMLGSGMFAKPMFGKPTINENVALAGDKSVTILNDSQDENEEGYDEYQKENINHNSGGILNAGPKPVHGHSMLASGMFAKPMFGKPTINENVALAGDKSVTILNDSQDENEEGYDENHEENINKNSGGILNAGPKSVHGHSMLGSGMFAKPMFGKPKINKNVALAGDKSGIILNDSQDENEEGYDEYQKENINHNSGGILNAGPKPVHGHSMLASGMFAKPMFGKPTINKNAALAGDKSETILNDSQDGEQDQNEEGYDEYQKENINHNSGGILNAGPKPVHGHSMLASGMFAKPMFGKPTINGNVALAGDKSGTILNDSQDGEQDENEEGYDVNQEENINSNSGGILNSGPKPVHGHSMLGSGMFAKPMFGKPKINKNVALAGDKSGTILNDSQDENEEGYDGNQKENINHNSGGILNAGPKSVHGHSMLGSGMFAKPMFGKPKINKNVALAGDKSGTILNDSQDENEEGAGPKPVHGHSMLGSGMFAKPMFGKPTINENVALAGGKSGTLLNESQDENEEGYNEDHDNSGGILNARPRPSVVGQAMFAEPMFGKLMKNKNVALASDKSGATLYKSQEKDLEQNENEGYDENNEENGNSGGRGDVPRKPVLEHSMVGQAMFAEPMFGKPRNLDRDVDQYEEGDNDEDYNENIEEALAGDEPKRSVDPQKEVVGQNGYEEEVHDDSGAENTNIKNENNRNDNVHKNRMLGNTMFKNSMFSGGLLRTHQENKGDKAGVKGNKRNNKQADNRRKSNRRGVWNKRRNYPTRKPRQHGRRAHMSDNEIHSE